MARRRKGELPRYRLHKQSGQAVVSLPTGGTPRYRDVLLGPFDSPESKTEYTRVINEWLAAGQLAPPQAVNGCRRNLSVAELLLRFWKHAEQYYRLVDGSPSRELEHFKYALDPVVDLYGPSPACEFGPLKLKAVRQKMIDTRWFFVRFPAKAKVGSRWVPQERIKLDPPISVGEGQVGQTPTAGEAEWEGKWWPVEVVKSRQGLSRKLVNQRVDHIKRVFKWAVSDELVPSSVYEALRAVAGLRRGAPGTYERPKVKSVPWQHVEAVLPHLSAQVAAMVRVQALIGARETEVCMMRGRDIDRSGAVWWYKIDPNEVNPDGQAGSHKTAHHESPDGSAAVKQLPIGPKAQEILKPWLREDEDEYLFQPAEARVKQNAERREQRKTPLWPSHVKHQAKKKKAAPKRRPGDHYTAHSYARAISRACKLAGVPHWHPHRLKHNCGTSVKKKFGVDGARAFLGHTKLATTEIYLDKDMALVEQIALEMG